ncbi:hypothetical protein THRCLA_21105 [Thraustotheca clavata]|uniref:Protein kinase domain-containing protein n=1 Tax=Thraustotheca clavata TaxID=74557 RepID=A0A1W0A0D6_9STRA|nr:hypothetical protein THRCLA_21105 [Thraustotheca clavata]
MYKNEVVAIKKVIKRNDNTNELEREILAMQQCRSQYLLHLVGVSELNTHEVKLVLHYMDGGDLQLYLVKKRKNVATQQ